MDQDIFLVLDFDKSCRLCLQAKGAMSDIFELCEDTLPITEQIERTTGVIITNLDNLPKKICHKCRYIVELSFELRETVLRSNHLLNQTFDHDTSLETEKLETKTAKTDKESTIPIDTVPEDNTEQPKSAMSDNLNISELSMKVECEDTEEIDMDNDYIAVMVERDTTCIKNEWLPGDEDISDEPVKKSSRTRKSSLKNTPKYLTCLICLEVFDSRTSVFQHAATVHYQGTGLTPYMITKKPFTCNLCGSTNATRRELLLHHLSHLDVNPFVCEAPNCEFRAKSKAKLRHHSYSHGERKYICETCGTAFRRKFELMQHAMRHADEGSTFPCRLCRVVCRNRLSYKAHLRYHELGHRFKCPKLGCPKGFYSRNDLQVHLRAHNNERLFRCHMCVSSYVSQSQLNRHLRQHEKQRISKCDKCSATFSNYTQFYNHRVAAHGPWQPHKCRGCNQGYQSTSQLENHMTRCRLAQNIKILECEENTDNSGKNTEDGNSNDGFNDLICSSNDGFGNSNNDIGNSSNGIGDPDNDVGNSSNYIGNPNNDVGNSSNYIGNPNNDVGNSSNCIGNPCNYIGNAKNGIVNSNNGVGNSSYGSVISNNVIGDSSTDIGNSNNGIGNSSNGVGNSNSCIGNSKNAVGNSNVDMVGLDLEEFLGQRFCRTVTGPVLLKPSMLKNVKMNIRDDQLPADSLLYIEVDNEEDVDDPGSQCYSFAPN